MSVQLHIRVLCWGRKYKSASGLLKKIRPELLRNRKPLSHRTIKGENITELRYKAAKKENIIEL
jgi:hypothetical protein